MTGWFYFFKIHVSSVNIKWLLENLSFWLIQISRSMDNITAYWIKMSNLRVLRLCVHGCRHMYVCVCVCVCVCSHISLCLPISGWLGWMDGYVVLYWHSSGICIPSLKSARSFSHTLKLTWVDAEQRFSGWEKVGNAETHLKANSLHIPGVCKTDNLGQAF